MKIDLTIGYDDLSQECKNKIKQLKVMGFNVELHYPELKKSNNLEYIHFDGSGLQISPTYANLTSRVSCGSASAEPETSIGTSSR